MTVSLSQKSTDKHKDGFFIGVTCPGCGGELELGDNLSILICDHCGSVLRVIMPDVPPAYVAPSRITQREIRFSIDRYLKQENLPLTGSGLQYRYLYYPYWKIDAILLKLRNKVEERVIGGGDEYDSRETVTRREKTEINLTPYMNTFRAGQALEGLPEAIGIRAQYIKVVPFSREKLQEDYRALPVIRNWEDVWPEIVTSIARMTEMSAAQFGINKTEFLHEHRSIVFFPVIMAESYDGGTFNRFLVDGVTGRVLSHITEPPAIEETTDTDTLPVEFGNLDVVFHRCGNCGEDLPARKSYVNVCENCRQVNLLESTGFPMSEILFVDKTKGSTDQFYPFWSFRIQEAQADELKRIFGGVYRSDWLTLPAFRVSNFEAMYRLAKRVSAAAPRLEGLQPVEDVDNRFLPVTINATEARDLADVIIFRHLVQNKPGITPGDIEFVPDEARLLYLPFYEQQYFFVDSIMEAITFERRIVD